MIPRILKYPISNRLAWCGWVGLLQNQPCALHGRETSLDPKNKTGRVAALLIYFLIAFRYFPLLIFKYVQNSFSMKFVKTLCSVFVTSLRQCIYMVIVGTIPVDFIILDSNE